MIQIPIENGLKDKVLLFRSKIGLFFIIDYFTDEGLKTAKGILKDVSDTGDMEIVHVNDPKQSWGINIHQIKNYKANNPWGEQDD